MESSARVQEKLCRTASVAIELEARLGTASMAQEQSRVIAERAQVISQQAMQETKALHVVQQVMATKIKEGVAQIGL